MIERIKEIAITAGAEILKIYNDPTTDFGVEMKSDDSPLTIADQKSNDVIVKALSSEFPEIPILSEEEAHQDYETRKTWTKFWCVDPLDGTKEFIKKNGEFTVNIALIENGIPVLGVIHVPVKNVTYWGDEHGAFKSEEGNVKKITTRNRGEEVVAVRSKSHASEEEEVVLTKYGVTDSISVGSSLKFCMVAEGKADVYFRFGPTMEWDTAAGQAIVQAAGGKVFQGDREENVFSYNKENLRNGSFLCLGL